MQENANINIKDLIPGKPTHPGAILADELEANGMSQIKFAVRSGIHKTTINEIIKGRRGISQTYAILFEHVLGIPARYWLDAQVNYDLDLARKTT